MSPILTIHRSAAAIRRQVRTVRQQNGSMHKEAGQDGAPQGVQVIFTALQRHLHRQQRAPQWSALPVRIPSGINTGTLAHHMDNSPRATALHML
jgi:hypothetical protein